jgi:hypothetical protein
VTEDLERRLRDSLDGPLPPAPDLLRAKMHDVVDEPLASARVRRSPWLLVAATVGLVVVVLAALISGGSPEPSPSDPPPTSSSPDPPQTSSAAPAPPASPEPLTVSEFLAGIDRGDFGSDSILVQGYWSDRSIGHSCAPTSEPVGDLEIRCHDGEFGITERLEPIGTLLDPGGSWAPASGPSITPYVEESMAEPLFTLPGGNGQRHAPIPIVVRGHINDPRARECQPKVLEVCQTRLVIDEIVEFDPSAVPTPGVTVPPSPFPFDDPPPALFGSEDCAGDVPYAFVGWATAHDVGLDLGDPQAVVYAMVTRDTTDLQGRGGRTARWICYAYEWDEGTIGFSTIP